MPWKRMIAYTAGKVNGELLEEAEYLREENKILKSQMDKTEKRILLSNEERISLAVKGKALGSRLAENISIVSPETLLKWHRMLVAKKFDYSERRKKQGQEPVPPEVRKLVVEMATENPSWGCDRIVGAMKNLGHRISDTTVGKILREHGISPSPERTRGTSWARFIKSHKDVLWATDFFTEEVWSPFGLVTVYVLFFIQISTRKVVLGGVTQHPNSAWVEQVARNVTGYDGELTGAKYLIHDRDGKYTDRFDFIFKGAGCKAVKLPAKSPNLNAVAERFVRSIKESCMHRLILFGEKSLKHAVKEYIAHYNHERNHQGMGNELLFPDERAQDRIGKIVKDERLGGLLNYYYRETG